MTYPIKDPYFRVEVLSKTERPNLLSYLAMHQCYSEKVVIDEVGKLSQLSESELGDRIVKNCIKFGHYSVIEPPHITFCVSGFPHNVMAQATRHRNLSFSVQSMRYTGNRLVEGIEGIDLTFEFLDTELEEYSVLLEFDPKVCQEHIDKLIYLRPIGVYPDRFGNKKEYTERHRNQDLCVAGITLAHYANRLKEGFAPEHARGCLVYDFRQDFVVTFNARNLLHFCDLRTPSDAQVEIRTLAQMLFEHFKAWMPECAEWYEKHRYAKNRLSP